MFKEIIEQGYVSFHQHFDSWEDAITASYQPLVEKEIVNDTYIQQVIACVREYGPYIVIVPGVAMPHSTQGCDGCYGTAIAFMKVKDEVVFDEYDPEKKACLFFSLAAMDSDEHLRNIQELMNCLMRDDIMEVLWNAESVEDLKKAAELELL